MTPKVLIDLAFSDLISEASAQTATGSRVVNNFKTFLMANPESCGLVNNFIREASKCQYDTSLMQTLAVVTDYVTANKTSWAIASACESILADERSYNMLNRNAAHQAAKLLEMNEDDVVKYIRAGALKNVMFCEAFRTIAKGVFAGAQIVEHTAEYKKTTPISLVENVGDGVCFVVAGQLYKCDDDKNIQVAEWSEVSNTFKTVESLLESKLVEFNEDNVIISYNNHKYTISEAGKVKDNEKDLTVEQFRDNINLLMRTINPRRAHEVAGVMEAIALLSENYDGLASLDNTAIYETARDKFVVIEAGANLYADLLVSNHSARWTVNEDAVKVCDFIKSRTNVTLSDIYTANIKEAVDKADEESREQIKETLENNTILSLKERIDLLTEKFKNDPAKLAVLSKLATDIQNY